MSVSFKPFPTIHASISGVSASVENIKAQLSYPFKMVCQDNPEDVFERTIENVPLQGIYYQTLISPRTEHDALTVQSKILFPPELRQQLHNRIMASTTLEEEDKRDILTLWNQQQKYHSSLTSHDAGHIATLTPTNSFGEVANFVQGIALSVIKFKTEKLTPADKAMKTSTFVKGLLETVFNSEELGLTGKHLPAGAKHTNGIYNVKKVFAEYKGDLSHLVTEWLGILDKQPTLVTKINQTASEAQLFLSTSQEGKVTANYTPEETHIFMQLLDVVLQQHQEKQKKDRPLFPNVTALFLPMPSTFIPVIDEASSEILSHEASQLHKQLTNAITKFLK